MSGGIGGVEDDEDVEAVVVVVGKLGRVGACGGSEVDDDTAEGCSRLVSVRQKRGQRKLGGGGKHIFPFR